nr:MAG TPA: hypothetical protein [Caudoviricetes sp.]
MSVYAVLQASDTKFNVVKKYFPNFYFFLS